MDRGEAQAPHVRSVAIAMAIEQAKLQLQWVSDSNGRLAADGKTVDQANRLLDNAKKLIDTAQDLLDREEYALFWAMKWADVLRGSPVTISERGVHRFHRYLLRSLADDKPVSQLTRELLHVTCRNHNKPSATP